MNTTYLATGIKNIQVKVLTERKFTTILESNGDTIKSVRYELHVLDGNNVLRQVIKGYAPICADHYEEADHPVLTRASRATQWFYSWYSDLGFFRKLITENKECIQTLCMMLQTSLLCAVTDATARMISIAERSNDDNDNMLA